MTESIEQRLREAAATLPAERVSMQALAQAHGPAAHGTWLLLMAATCLLPVPGVGTVLGLGLVFCDGVAVVLGPAMAGLATGVTAAMMPMAWAWGSEWLLGWLSM